VTKHSQNRDSDSSEPIEPKAGPGWGRQRRVITLILAVLLAAGLGIAAWFLFYRYVAVPTTVAAAQQVRSLLD
jgi:multidrug resistance efflux pump